MARSLPLFVVPCIPVLSAEPPSGSGWIHEIKHDGFRTLIRIVGKDIRAFTRGGLDWSDKYGPVVNACRKFQCRSALIDGEVIVQDKNGVSDFAASPHVMIWSQGGAGCMPAPSQIRT